MTLALSPDQVVRVGSAFVVISGPPASGKSTTVYRTLQRSATPDQERYTSPLAAGDTTLLTPHPEAIP
jgi:GTPase SAR1 family protein